MLDSMVTVALTIATIGAGLMAGVYFAFSAFIMRSFDQLNATQAIEAMNAINEIILRSHFMLLFFGSTLLYAILSVYALIAAELSGRWLLFITGVIYVFGMFLCTAAFNVPLNNRLAQAGNDNSTHSELWTLYFRQWTQWNHLRTGCSLAVMALSINYLLNFS